MVHITSQGCREVAVMIDMLQGSASFLASGSYQKVIETTLVSAGRILQESLKYPNDIARHHALRSVAAALAQALVPANQSEGWCNGDTFQRAALSEQEQKRNDLQNIIDLNLSNDVLEWDAASLLSRKDLLAISHTNALNLPSTSVVQANQPVNTLDSLLQLALHVPSLDIISGAPSMLLKTARQVPLPSFNTCSTDVIKHSQEAWTAYLTIHPQVKKKKYSQSSLVTLPYFFFC
jgi:hypothetical protein